VPEKKIRLIGAGGHGILTLGRIIGEAAIRSGMEAVMTIGYSPAQRGGWSRADVIISNDRIDYPIFTNPDILVATTQESYDIEYVNVGRGKTIIYEKSIVETRELEGVRQIGIDAMERAIRLGARVVANIIILGFMNTLLNILPEDAIIDTIKGRIKRKYLELNLRAYMDGKEYALEILGGGDE